MINSQVDIELEHSTDAAQKKKIKSRKAPVPDKIRPEDW